jgi:hypothetical protein
LLRVRVASAIGALLAASCQHCDEQHTPAARETPALVDEPAARSALDAPVAAAPASAAEDACAGVLGPLPAPDAAGAVAKGSCTTGTGGTWALRLDRPAEGAKKTPYTLLFARASLRLQEQGELAAGAMDWIALDLENAVSFDFDGDGSPEYFVTATLHGRNSIVVTQFFMTARPTLRPYPPAAGLPVESLADVDGDGRPDALVRYDLGMYSYCYIDEASPYLVEVVAHSLVDGTFSLTDAVAERRVRERCPSAPSGSPMSDGSLDVGALECARLWGQSGDAVRARVAAACGPARGCDHACPERELYEAIARWKPPLTLR